MRVCKKAYVCVRAHRNRKCLSLQSTYAYIMQVSIQKTFSTTCQELQPTSYPYKVPHDTFTVNTVCNTCQFHSHNPLSRYNIELFSNNVTVKMSLKQCSLLITKSFCDCVRRKIIDSVLFQYILPCLHSICNVLSEIPLAMLLLRMVIHKLGDHIPISSPFSSVPQLVFTQIILPIIFCKHDIFPPLPSNLSYNSQLR